MVSPDLTYAAAVEHLTALAQAEADPAVNPICRSFALTQGERSERCIVLLHGFTNCPQQFRAFAELLAARGHSVFVPRAPGHGLSDRLTKALGDLTGAKLITWLDQMLMIAHGLGERVDLLGLSSGANLAAYAAQRRADVYQSIMLAPVLGTPSIAAWATAPVACFAARGPNLFRWWDVREEAEMKGPLHAYPRYSTRALGEIVRLGLRVLREARTRPPLARELLLITNANDEAVTNAPTEQLAARWLAHGVNVRTHCFPKSLGLIHDCIDPSQPLQQTDIVYPVLIELMG